MNALRTARTDIASRAVDYAASRQLLRFGPCPSCTHHDRRIETHGGVEYVVCQSRVCRDAVRLDQTRVGAAMLAAQTQNGKAA